MNRTKREFKLSNVLLGLLGTVAAAAFPALFLYFQNASEAHFGDITVTLAMFVAVGVGLFFIMLMITGKPAKSGLSAIIFLIVFLNYALIERLIRKAFPALRYWHIAPALLVLLLHAVWAIYKRMPDDTGDIIMPVLSGVLAILIVYNGVTAIPKIHKRVQAEAEAKKRAAQENVALTDLPNFYFILFDEYSTIPFMQKYFNYDNSALLGKLEALGFNNSQTGHNDCIMTAVVTANLFQLDYLGKQDVTRSEELFKMRSDNPVFDQFRTAGYDIVCPAGATFYGLEDALGKKTKASTITGEDINAILLLNTVAYPFVSRYRLGEAQTILDQMNYLKENIPEPNSGHFILAHINCPHEPFYFDREGNINKVISNSWSDLDQYSQQYQFISSELTEIAERIVSHDPNAIIWILSDHGARAASDPNTFGIFTLEDMTNYFSALYYQGQTFDIEGLSGVNTFRILLNKLFGTDYAMIPLPTE